MAELLSTRIKKSLKIYSEDNTSLIFADSNALTCNVPLKVNKNYTGNDYKLITDDSGIFKYYNPANVYINNEYYYTIRALSKNSYDKDTLKKIDIPQITNLNFTKDFTLTTISIPKEKIKENDNSSIFGASLNFEISTNDLLDACEKNTSLNFDLCSLLNVSVKYKQNVTIKASSLISGINATINSMTKYYPSTSDEENSYYIINVPINTTSLENIKNSIIQYGADINGSFKISFTFTNKHPVYDLKNNLDLKNLKAYYSVSYINSISLLNSLTNITSDLFINDNMFLKADSNSLYIDNLILYEDKIFSKIKKYGFSMSSTDGKSFIPDNVDDSNRPMIYDYTLKNLYSNIFDDFDLNYKNRDDIYIISSDLIQPASDRYILQDDAKSTNGLYYLKKLNSTQISYLLKIQAIGTISVIFYAICLQPEYNYERFCNKEFFRKGGSVQN